MPFHTTPKLFFLDGILIFLWVGAHTNLLNPKTTPSGTLITRGETKKINLTKKMTSLSCSAGRTHFAQTIIQLESATVPTVTRNGSDKTLQKKQ